MPEISNKTMVASDEFTALQLSQESLLSGSSHTMALNARMMDCFLTSTAVISP